MKKLIRNTYNFFFSLFVIPFLILIIFIFLFRNRKIFSNKLIYPFFIWSFGHQIFGLDIPSRLYYPNKISLININYKRNNKYLVECYQNYDIFHFNHFFNDNFLIKKISRNIFFIVLSLLSFFSKFKYSIIDYHNNFSYLSMRISSDSLSYYNEIKNEISEYGDLTGYINLLKIRKDADPKLPDHYTRLIELRIKEFYPNFQINNFVTILLRKKGLTTIMML